jgi:nucleotide sugar dehydrogenase
MVTRKTIGFCGYGVVNKAVANGFRKYNEIFLYDEPKGLGSLDEICKCDFIFVSVPTPMVDPMGGSIDLSIMDKVIGEIAKRVDKGYQIVIVKSTVVPGTMERYAMLYPTVKFVYNPEFLTEKNSLYDFCNQDRIVIGSNDFKSAYELGTLYRTRFPDTAIMYTGFGEAQMIKYASNCFLATKVAYANEIYRICKAFNVDYSKVKEGMGMDKRIGHSHLDVPGNDGQYGFSGKCFPKDLCALIAHCESVGYTPQLLETVWKSNLTYRTKYDWKDIPGAVSCEIQEVANV